MVSTPLEDLDDTLKSLSRLEKRLRRPRGRRRRFRLYAVGTLFCAALLAIAIPPFRYPVAGRVSSLFFLRRRPESSLPFAIEMHDGLDVAAGAGAPVLASAPGVVIQVGYDESSGNFVRVRHLFGLSTFYGHLSEILVRPGRIILLRSIRPIGLVGSTGRSTGPHVHFELAIGRRTIPPRVFLIWHDIRRALVGL